MKTVERCFAEFENSNPRWKSVSLDLAGAILAVTCIVAAAATFVPQPVYDHRVETVNEQSKTDVTIEQAKVSNVLPHQRSTLPLWVGSTLALLGIAMIVIGAVKGSFRIQWPERGQSRQFAEHLNQNLPTSAHGGKKLLY